ncbi:MAG: gamma-glutamyl-gamma-aminobutyrate hydrolase family protein [Bryobacteraceae bacterium]
MIRVALPFGSRTPESKRGPYRQALDAAKIQPVENAATLAGLDGLLLAGGSDIDPALYGASRQPESGKPDHQRDSLEIALLHEALDRDLPVLAICRGHQLLNVVLGGTLVQHIERHKCPQQQEVHPITIAPHSRLQSILGVDEYVVNSRHHQCVDRVASGLVVAARAPDSVIEALELPGKRFVLAVQWHPEDRTDRLDARLFAAFLDAMNRSSVSTASAPADACRP